MGQKELYLLASNGFRFQSHTQSHPDLNLLSIDELKSEYVGSRNILYNFFDVEIKEICFPKGFFNYSTIAVAYESGYEGLYSSIPGSFHEKNDFNIIYRNLVQFSSPFDFKCILFGGLNIFRNRYTKQHYHEQ
jgi:peptidoglycan/xylan/chitin deacetylase (PgdA/CDA1 family)